MQGEYLGGVIPHLLLVGRRGQPFWWSPFENGAGNHNIAICGKSGSGKSVLLQELCAALRGAGAKVVVIDDGRSFEHSVKLQGGRFAEFTIASGFSLNPFSMVDDARAHEDEDYRLDCFAMIKAIVGQMARPGTAPSDTERGLIDRAVTATWEELGSGASVDDVAHALHGSESEAGRDLATAIAPFCRGGSYGGFFAGKASFALDDDFTVFEMSDLASREELRSVVLSAIMFMTSQAMTRSSRATKKLLLIDEAWAMLKGGSMGEFVETYARTARKYGGALATATQSLNDYYKSDGARAALENSDWMLVLQQKAETIADFKGERAARHGRPHRDADPQPQAFGDRVQRGLHQRPRDRGGRSARARSLLGDDLFLRSRHLCGDPGLRAALGHSLADAIRIVAGGGQ